MTAQKIAMLENDAHLDPTIQAGAPRTPHWMTPQTILLTGATGFLGAYVLDELLRSSDAMIYCLVRAADRSAAQSRLEAHLQDYGLWQPVWRNRIVPIVGDLGLPYLGLTEAAFQDLAGVIDSIYHNGAWINALFPYNQLRAVNVLGTQEIIRLSALQQTKPLHYVSTLAIFLSDMHVGQRVDETRIPSLDPTIRGGYKQSKWVAEALVRDAQARGLPAAIYRSGRIMGHSQTGVNGNPNDALCTVLKGCVELGQFPRVDTRIDVTPVDYVSQAIVQLSRQPDALGRSFHITNPQPVVWNELLEQIATLGYRLNGVAYEEWVAAINAVATQSSAEAIYQQLRLLLRSPIYLFAQSKPLFNSATTRQFLADLACPAIDQQVVTTYFRWFQQTGYMPDPQAASASSETPPATPGQRTLKSALYQQIARQRQNAARQRLTDIQPPRLVQPLIIVSAPRAGSTLLFETLAHFAEIWTIGQESHEIIEGIADLHPAAHGYASNRLTATDATPAVISLLHDRFARQVYDRSGRHVLDLPETARPASIRLLEKTPKNALRIPFLRALFPDARFLFLYREPAANISSILEGWQSRRFIAYRSLPNWPHGPWSFLLPPGWESLRERPLVEIAAYQWLMANETILTDLADLPRDTWHLVQYADLVATPEPIIRQIAAFADLLWDDTVEQLVTQALPVSRMTVSAPAPDKWLKHADEMATVLPTMERIVRQVHMLYS